MSKILIAVIVMVLILYGIYMLIPWTECSNYLSSLEKTLIESLTR
jgi:hypothetical protein